MKDRNSQHHLYLAKQLFSCRSGNDRQNREGFFYSSLLDLAGDKFVHRCIISPKISRKTSFRKVTRQDTPEACLSKLLAALGTTLCSSVEHHWLPRFGSDLSRSTRLYSTFHFELGQCNHARYVTHLCRTDLPSQQELGVGVVWNTVVVQIQHDDVKVLGFSYCLGINDIPDSE